MSYKVIVLPAAKQSIIEVGTYIVRELGEPATANKYVNDMEKAIRGLSDLPKRIKVVDDEVLGPLGVRKLIVKSFYVYYTVHDENETVFVNDVIYTRAEKIPKIEK